jgi:hypothetical protein
MKKLLTSALLLALAGPARADAPAQTQAAPAAGAEKPGKAAAARRGAKEKQKEKRGDEAAPPPAKTPEKAPDAQGEKPCQPVKPCPID